MEAYADYNDFMTRYPHSTTPQEVVEASLLDVSAMISVLWEQHGVAWNFDDDYAMQVLKRIVCAAAYRAVSPPTSIGGLDLSGIKQTSWTADSFNQQVTVANPDRDIRLWPSELQLLGIGYNRYRTLYPMRHTKRINHVN